jgi:putative thioredoxin
MDNLGGAYDLSQRSDDSAVKIPGWLVPANEQVFRSYLELSSRVPVLLFISSAATQPTVRDAIAQAIASAQGRFAGIEVAAEANPQLVTAVGITAPDALVAILMGQPAVISQGGIEVSKLPAILGQLAQLAEQNGLSGRVRVDQAGSNTGAQPEPELSPEHQAAFDALTRGDFAAARESYQQLLASAPADQMAKSGLAQVELMIRLQGLEADQVLRGADQLLAGGDPGAAFELLLNEFAGAVAERREEIRQRLIELFLLFPDDDATVIAARRRLSSLLF